MSVEHRSDLSLNEPCPPLPMLLAFLENTEEPEGRGGPFPPGLGEHLERCAACQHQLEIWSRRRRQEILGLAAGRALAARRRRWFLILLLLLWRHGKKVAVVLLFVGLLAALTGASAVAVQQAGVAEQTAKDADQLRQELEQLKKSLITTPPAPDPYAQDFASGLEVAVQFDQARPNRLRLLLNDNVRLPYFNALKVVWDWHEGMTEVESLYYWRSRPLPAVAEKDYDPTDMPRPVTVKLLFYPTAEAQERLKVPDVIERTITVLRTPQGLTVPPPPGAGVTARLTAPADGARVGETFVVGLTVTPPAKPSPQEDAVVHVLLRPMNGSAVWQDRYIILPLRLRVGDVARAAPDQRHYTVTVSLRALLGSPSPSTTPAPEEVWPTRFEVLAVELPFKLPGWHLSRDLLDLSKPGMKELVKDVRRVELDPAAGLTPAPGSD